MFPYYKNSPRLTPRAVLGDVRFPVLFAGLNRSAGAGIAARTEIDAGARIDLILRVTLTDRTDGASVDTCAAVDAGIVDYIRHFLITSI